MIQNVAILGASPKPERYANKAQTLLKEHNHKVFPINPAYKEINGIQTVPKITDIKEPIDTLTLYMGPARLKEQIKSVIEKKPKRIIMNPGTEDDEIMKIFEKAGITVVKACTLVMLKTGQFSTKNS